MDLEENISKLESLAKEFLLSKNIITVGNTTTGSEVDLSNVLALFVEKMQKPQPMHNLMKMFKTAEGILVVKPPKDIDFDKLVELIKGISKKPTFVQENESGLGLHGMPFNVEFSKDYLWNEPVIMTGFKEYKEYMRDCPDPSFNFEDWKDMMDKYNQVTKEALDEVIEPFTWIDKDSFDVLSGKKEPTRIGIIGNVDNGKSIMMHRLGARNIGKTLMASIEQIPFELNGLGQAHHKGIIAIVPDKATMDYASEITRMIAKDTSIKNIIVVTKEQYDAQGKDSLLKASSIGITQQMNEVPVFNYDIINKDSVISGLKELWDKSWDTKKQKRNNYIKKRRK